MQSTFEYLIVFKHPINCYYYYYYHYYFIIYYYILKGVAYPVCCLPYSTDDTVIEHSRCLGKALDSYYIGDTIVVFPGKYSLDRVYQLVDSVHITGKGNCSEIIGKVWLPNDQKQ